VADELLQTLVRVVIRETLRKVDRAILIGEARHYGKNSGAYMW
jgi:hypothetical protein